MGGLPAGNENNSFEANLGDCFLSNFQMTLMDGVESPSKKSDFLPFGHSCDWDITQASSVQY